MTDKVRFISVIPGLDEVMPIIKTSEYKHKWKKRASLDLGDKEVKCPVNKILNVSRCPGINNIQSVGWVLRLWQDVTIETNEDGDKINWSSAFNQSNERSGELINFHDDQRFGKYRTNWPKDTAKHIIKINTGWNVIIPKGYNLLQLPVAMADENEFTAVEGMYGGDLGPATLNVPVYWHNIGNTKTIKAGTPLAQFILVPDEEYEYSVEPSTEEINKIFDVYGRIINNTFVSNYNKVKQWWASR